MSKLLKSCLILLIVGIVICAIPAVLLYRDYQNSIDNSISDSDKEITFIIEEGETVDQIAQNLESEGLIKHELYFKLYIRQENLESKIQAGSFKIPKNVSMKELVEILQSAKVPDITVTIPESLMVTEIADILETGFAANPEPSFDKEGFLELTKTSTFATDQGIPIPEDKPLEGYIFPDTYTFPSDASNEYVLTAILTDGFRKKIYEKYMQQIEDSEFSLYEILTLASILERETRHSEDRPLVADILIRRLQNNWALEVDATLLYHFGDWKHEITYQDLQLDTKYNTRKHTGLTPTPICNPGEETINAVLNPESNDYWFYISDTNGTLHYAKTLEEHNANIAKYLQ